MTTFRAELVFIYKRGLQSLPSPCQRRFAGVPRDFSSLNKPTHFLAEGLADYGWGDICQRGIARTPLASHFLDDRELKWEVDVCIFPPFPFLSFPLLLTSPSQSITGGVEGCPSPTKNLPQISATPSWEGLRIKPLQRGPGTTASANKCPNRWGCSKQVVLVLHKYSLPAKCYQDRPVCSWLSPYFTLEAPFISG